MLGTVQKTNMNRVFDTLDTIGNGVIEADDFTTMAQRMRAVNPAMDQQTQAEIDQAFAEWWETFRTATDTDADGQITRDEFLTAVERGIDNDPRWIERMVNVSKVVFHAADTEGNGQLTHEQVDRIYQAFGVDDSNSTETFARIDSDGSGTIGVEEYIQAAREVYQTNDPAAPGAVMFGSLN